MRGFVFVWVIYYFRFYHGMHRHENTPAWEMFLLDFVCFQASSANLKDKQIREFFDDTNSNQ